MYNSSKACILTCYRTNIVDFIQMFYSFFADYFSPVEIVPIITKNKYQVVKVSPGGSLPSLPLPRTAVDMSADGCGHVHGWPRTCPRPCPRLAPDMSKALSKTSPRHVQGCPRLALDMSKALSKASPGHV